MYVLHPYNLGGGAHRNSMGKENVRTYLYYFFSGWAVFPLKVLVLKQIFYDIRFRSAPFLLSRF